MTMRATVMVALSGLDGTDYLAFSKSVMVPFIVTNEAMEENKEGHSEAMTEAAREIAQATVALHELLREAADSTHKQADQLSGGFLDRSETGGLGGHGH